jgi:hypothetical protein
VTELGVTWVNVSDRDGRSKDELVRATAVEVGPDPLDRPRGFVGT